VAGGSEAPKTNVKKPETGKLEREKISTCQRYYDFNCKNFACSLYIWRSQECS